ncbi:MAG: hypothetical protein KatS3mg071_2769 [Meiothermus sp.]|nr:MAG: hypothetical protein KatS3mg071_2769 [Meiothermus sp.]
MPKNRQDDNLTSPARPQPVDPPTTRNYLEALARASAYKAAVDEALLTNDTATLEARLAMFAQARRELVVARTALFTETARWVRAMFRPWKGVRYG